MKTSSSKHCKLPFVAVVALFGSGISHTYAQDSQIKEEPGFEELYVTARKKAESLLEVPIAVTAFTSEQIDEQGILGFNSLADQTAGMTITNTNSGRNDRSFQQITLRGMTPTTTQSTLTATFINGIPVASASGVNALEDPARVEVLKGPQSAQFGRNAFAGAVNVVTKEASNELKGWFSVEAGSRDSYDAGGAIEGPILGDNLLSFRATASQWERGGSYTNLAADSLGEELGTRKTTNGTLALLSEPTDKLSIKLLGIYAEDEDGPSNEGMVSAIEVRGFGGSGNPANFSGDPSATVIQPGQANCTLPSGAPFICGEIPGVLRGPSANTPEDPRLREILADGTNRIGVPSVDGYGLAREFTHFQGVVSFEATEAITVTSLTGFTKEETSELDDLDNMDTSLITAQFSFATFSFEDALSPRGYWNFPFLVERRVEDFSQEIRMEYADEGPVDFMIGASYLETESDRGLVDIAAIEEGRRPTARDRDISPSQRAETTGIFGSISVDVTEKFAVTAEGRYQEDEVFLLTGGAEAGLTLIEGNQFGLPAGTFPANSEVTSVTFDNFLPRVIAEYQATNDMMVYASWSEAANILQSSFNSSFINGSAAEVAAGREIGLGVIVQPEELENYEIGMKGKFFDDRLIVTAAAYYAEWSDQHNNQTVFAIDEELGATTIVTGIANTGSADLYGLEIDLVARPMKGLEISFAGAINESQYNSFADPQITTTTGLVGDDFEGNQIPLTSKYSAVLGVRYSADFSDTINWYIRGDGNYNSKQFIDAANLTWIGDRTTVNARLGATYDDFISVELFALNLFDNQDYVSAFQNQLLTSGFEVAGGAYDYINVAMPERRFVGAKVKFEF